MNLSMFLLIMQHILVVIPDKTWCLQYQILWNLAEHPTPIKNLGIWGLKNFLLIFNKASVTWEYISNKHQLQIPSQRIYQTKRTKKTQEDHKTKEDQKTQEDSSGSVAN